MTLPHSVFSYPDGNRALYLEGPLTDAVVDEIVRQQINRIVVVSYVPWKASRLEMLRSIVDELWLQTPTAPLGLVESFPALRSVHLECAADRFDFSWLSNLRECALSNQRATPVGLARCSQLVSLSISNSKLKDIEALSGIRSLRKLVLGSVSVPSLAALGALQELRHLGVTRFQEADLGFLSGLRLLEQCYLDFGAKLFSLSGIESASQLRDLSLSSCPKLADLSPLQSLAKLERLVLESCPGIGSLKPLRGHPTLTKLLLWEKTKVADGDMKSLLNNPKLSEFSFLDRRNYNLKTAEACDFLKARKT